MGLFFTYSLSLSTTSGGADSKESPGAFQGALVVKTLPANAEDIRDTGSIPGWGRSPEGGNGNGNPLQYSCLRNPMDRGTLGATVHGVTKESDTTERLTHTVLKWAQGSKYHHMPMFLCFCLHPRPLLNSRLRWPTA